MAQFGAGSALAAQCPIVPTPDGYRPWADADGPIPDALAKRAQAISLDPSIPLGATESYPLPGVTTLIRIEPRVWGRDAQGNLVEGCFRTGGIFIPSGSPSAAGITPPSTSSGIQKTIAVLTVASLAVGTAATIAAWKGRRG
jgi:hypothetical protein